MHGWRGAHAWFVRVERALHACARVQGAAQRARARQWRGRGTSRCACGGDLHCARWSAFCTAKVKSNSSAESVAPSRLSTGRPTDAVLARSLQHSARNSVCARRCSWTVRTQEAIYLTRIIWYRIATAHVQNHMPANKQKNNERAANYQMRQELRALDHLHEELSAAAQLSVQSSAKPSEKLMGAELASHLVRHNWCVTTRRSTRFMLHVCSPSLWLCCEVSSVHSGAVPSHAMDPANAFTFHGAVGDGRALFGSTRGERPQANKAHLSSVPSPWALPGGGSDACAHSSSAAPAGTANLHAIGRLLDPCVCALLRHVGSVLIEIGSAPRGCSSGDDDERGEMGGVSGVGNSAVERG